MPGLIEEKGGVRKKRRIQETKPPAITEPKINAYFSLMKDQILESRQHYYNISTLLRQIRSPTKNSKGDILAALALCQVFCKFMVLGRMSQSVGMSENDITVTEWLSERYEDYVVELLAMLTAHRSRRSKTALTLLMRVAKEENMQGKLSKDGVWRDRVFQRLLRSLIEGETLKDVRTEFINNYFRKFHDVRFNTIAWFNQYLSGNVFDPALSKIISIMAAVEKPPHEEEDLQDFFVSYPTKPMNILFSPRAHKKQAQEAWMALLKRNLSSTHRKIILDLVPSSIAPWFLKVELLMDFLTDSFNVDGSMSLSALSGLFYLIREKNLDYPQFYPKLYSLLDSNIMHSKYRSRFFRLLDVFLSSTHLPAALIASFIKKFSRLTLNAPASGIVVVVPWIYNLLKKHPTCTYMIHNTLQRAEDLRETEEGWGDPFRADEADPMNTDALESSLWEIYMLQSHFHPNVATMAKIISEQFTKQAYDLEDFLDHSYGSMVDVEVSKELRNSPEIEYEIPKKIFHKHEMYLNLKDSLLVELWDFT